jgi:hypothetical protein
MTSQETFISLISLRSKILDKLDSRTQFDRIRSSVRIRWTSPIPSLGKDQLIRISLRTSDIDAVTHLGGQDWVMFYYY